jgi:phosphate transport system substrate-binding protein
MIEAWQRCVVFTLASFGIGASCCLGQTQGQQAQEQGDTIQEIRAALDAIDPYLPSSEITAEIEVFGATSMDTMAHGWAVEFKKFYPKSQIAVSTEGSETVFNRLAANPASVGMLSRPVTAEELEKFKESGLKNPVAVMVAREPLGVFVNKENPLNAITFEQLVGVFCKGSSSENATWESLGVTGNLARQPVLRLGRDNKSGTHSFIKNYLFKDFELQNARKTFPSNAAVVEAVGESPDAIAICGLKCGGHAAKALHLKGTAAIFPDDDHAILVGGYPLIRPLTLVVDLGQTSDQGKASQEFVRFALSQAGQMQTILCGFFPFDPPRLRSEGLKLGDPKAETH